MTTLEGRSSPSPRKPRGLSPSYLLEDTDRSFLPDDLPSGSPAFSNYVDYAKHNTGRHSATREDTFRTPRSLSSRTTNVPTKMDKRWTLGDTKTLQEICEMGFCKSAQQFSNDVMCEMRGELHHAISGLHQEIHDREAANQGMLGQILEQMSHLHAQQQLPVDFNHPDIDLTPFANQVRASEATHLECFRSLLQKTEEGFKQDVANVHNEVLRMHTVVEGIETNFIKELRDEFRKAQGEEENLGLTTDDLIRRIEKETEKVFKLQQSLAGDFTELTCNIGTMQQEQVFHNQALDKALETHITALITAQNVSNKKRGENVITHIDMTLKAQNLDTKILMGELGKIQQALNIDFCQLVEELYHEPKSVGHDDPGNGIKIKKRVRESFAQTEAAENDDAWTQTDESLMKESTAAKKGKKGKPAAASLDMKKKASSNPDKVVPTLVVNDAEDLQAKMRENIVKVQYNVTDYYHEYGIAQAIATNGYFEQVTLFVIFLNALWIAIDTDMNHSTVLLEAHPVFQVVENAFCVFFTFEVVVRFLAFHGKSHAFKDPWFVFDTALVTMMITETWILTVVFALAGASGAGGLGNASILRMVRLARMARITRMARLLRTVPELVILIKGIGAASRSVCVFCLLWLIIIYVFAVVFRMLMDGYDVPGFESVPSAMNTLLVEGLLPDNSHIVNEVTKASPLFWAFMILFIGLAGVTIMYMLVGVLVDVVGTIASAEKEAMTVQAVASGLRNRLEQLGRDVEAPITKYEFSQLVSMPEIAAIIQDIGVDVVVLIDMAEILYEDPRIGAAGLNFQQFVEIILNMRGNNPSTVKDVKELVRVFKKMMQISLNGNLKVIQDEFKAIRNDISEMKLAVREKDDDSDLDEEEEGVRPSIMSRNTTSHLGRPSITGDLPNFMALLGQERRALGARSSLVVPEAETESAEVEDD